MFKILLNKKTYYLHFFLSLFTLTLHQDQVIKSCHLSNISKKEEISYQTVKVVVFLDLCTFIKPHRYININFVLG